MVYAPHLRLTASGYLGSSTGTAEEWSCSLSIGLANGGDVDLGTEAAFFAMRDAWSGFMTNTGAYVSNGCFLARLTLTKILPNGKYGTNPDGSYQQRVWNYSPVFAGTRASDRHPFQITMVLSLLTVRAGSTGKGRMFLPAPCVPILIGGTTTADARDELLDAGAGLVAAISTAAGPSLDVIVASSKGYNSVVTQCRMGLVPDTHRSRRADLLEQYATVDI
jgi:hypothetical protein